SKSGLRHFGQIDTGRTLTACPLRFQKRTKSRQISMSASAVSGLTHCSKKLLLNHLVGDSEQCRRHANRKRLRSLKVEHQFKFRGWVNWYVGGLLALEDTTGEVTDYVICLRKRRPVAHEPANSRELAAVIEGGHSVPRGQRNDLFALRDQE